jgi:TRAP-type C4-dicarboxylate transport system permease large subunit
LQTFRGVLPFIGAEVIRIGLLLLLPALTLFLPGMLASG